MAFSHKLFYWKTVAGVSEAGSAKTATATIKVMSSSSTCAPRVETVSTTTGCSIKVHQASVICLHLECLCINKWEQNRMKH